MTTEAWSYLIQNNCLLGDAKFLSIYILSNCFTSLAYFIIFFYFTYILIHNKWLSEIPFARVLLIVLAFFNLFAAFSNVLSVVILWKPVYSIYMVSEVMTAIISINIAMCHMPFVPRVLNQYREMTENNMVKLSQFQALIDSLPHVIIVTNKEGNVTTWSQRAELMFGWTAKEVIDKNINILISGISLKDIFKISKRDRTSGISLLKGQLINVSATRKSGDTFLARVYLSVWKNIQGETEIGIILYDMSEYSLIKSELEEKQKKLYELRKTELMAMSTEEIEKRVAKIQTAIDNLKNKKSI